MSEEQEVAVRIESYKLGKMVVDGESHNKDLKIVGNIVLPEWWRKDSHLLCCEDLEDVFAANPQILIVGTGHDGEMQVDVEVRKTCYDMQIRLIIASTQEAIENYHELLMHDVAAVFHLTC